VCDCAICTADIGAEFGDVRPLDEARVLKLSINGGQVHDRIVADSVFLTELANAGCITWSQREHLINIIQPRDRNERLTEFLTRRSVADFQKFINVLGKEQEFLVPLFLTDGGEVFSIIYNFSCTRCYTYKIAFILFYLSVQSFFGPQCKMCRA